MSNNKIILQAATTIFVALIFILLFDAQGLNDWATRLEIGKFRSYSLSVTGPLVKITASLGLDSPKRAVESGFRNAAGIETRAGFLTEKTILDTAKTKVKIDSLINISEDYTFSDTFKPLREKNPSSKNKLNLLLLGDSMMGRGLGTVISRKARRDTLFNVHRVSELSSGLTRSDYFDWFVQADNLLHEKNYDIVALSIGTNDAQAAEINGTKVPFGTELWKKEYSTKVREFVSIVSNNTDVVYWFGLPPMRDEGFDGRVKILNDIFAEVTDEFSNVIYYPLDGIIGDFGFNFTPFKHVRGKLTRVRLDDGIHFTNEGGALVAENLIAEIKNQIRQ